MSMIPVSSSAIRAVGYDGYNLAVQFHHSGTIYIHPGVPHSIFEEFMNSASMGSFYSHYIRGRYR